MVRNHDTRLPRLVGENPLSKLYLQRHFSNSKLNYGQQILHFVSPNLHLPNLNQKQETGYPQSHGPTFAPLERIEFITFALSPLITNSENRYQWQTLELCDTLKLLLHHYQTPRTFSRHGSHHLSLLISDNNSHTWTLIVWEMSDAGGGHQLHSFTVMLGITSYTHFP